MTKVDIVFCVVTYKNHLDINDFLNNLSSTKDLVFTYKVIIVNNYADEESLAKIREISKLYNCDFIENENKGYAHGNNLAIHYAALKYEYSFLVVCNPDTIIKSLEFEKLNNHKDDIIAPNIINLNNKKQNPMHFNYMPISEKIIYFGFKSRFKFILYSGIALNKFNRFINLLIMKSQNKNSKKIYACHGSFIIFSSNAIKKLKSVFDDNMFLFSEESDLARNALKGNINIIYRNDLLIYHKEDGSMNFSNKNLFEIQRDSYLYYYKKWQSS